MIPYTEEDLLKDFVTVPMADKTYKLVGNHIAGFCEGREAAAQAVALIISTERQSCPIYGPGYGIELDSLYGTNPPLVYARLEQRIREALLRDDRIEDVRDFSFTGKGGRVLVRFTVYGGFGQADVERMVMIDV